jgi:hypothetical protein
MEDVLSQLDAGSLDIKLTSEKLFINTPTSNEAFALRSVNGIGVVDLLDDYNNELNQYKTKQSTLVGFLGIGVLIAALGIYAITIPSTIFGFITLLIGFLISLACFTSIRNSTAPTMQSAVRIMMSGGNRDFQFDKMGVNSVNIAEFVAKVESTLTAHHKNNV